MSAIICPFCGKESASEDHCTKCRTRFTKEIRAAAFTHGNGDFTADLGEYLTALRVGRFLLMRYG